MDSEKGFWSKQFYMLSSLGLFYIILIALFAIPLVGTCVVILIKGVLDFRYAILAMGLLGLIALSVYAVKAGRRLWRRIRRDGVMAGDDVRRNLLIGKPVEVSILNGLLKFTYGHPQIDEHPSLPHQPVALLPQCSERDVVTDVVDQLQSLTELRRSGAIDSNEFNQLKTLLIESSTASCTASDHDLS